MHKIKQKKQLKRGDFQENFLKFSLEIGSYCKEIIFEKEFYQE